MLWYILNRSTRECPLHDVLLGFAKVMRERTAFGFGNIHESYSSLRYMYPSCLPSTWIFESICWIRELDRITDTKWIHSLNVSGHVTRFVFLHFTTQLVSPLFLHFREVQYGPSDRKLPCKKLMLTFCQPMRDLASEIGAKFFALY